MKRSVPLWTALLLAGCGFPYTPRALPPLSTPDANAAAPAPPYIPPRQPDLAAAEFQPGANIASPGAVVPTGLDSHQTPLRAVLKR